MYEYLANIVGKSYVGTYLPNLQRQHRGPSQSNQATLTYTPFHFPYRWGIAGTKSNQSVFIETWKHVNDNITAPI